MHETTLCIRQYRGLDWMDPDQYVPNIPSSKLHGRNPDVRTYSFSDFDQSVSVSPGLLAMLDGQVQVSGKRLHLHETMVLQEEGTVESLRPYSTLLHVSRPLSENDAWGHDRLESRE